MPATYIATVRISPKTRQAANKQYKAIKAEVAHCRSALATRPDDANIYFNMANLLREIDQFDEAEEAYLRAIELNPLSALMLFRYGELLRDTKRSAQATAIYQAAVLLEPDNESIHISLGMLLQANGQMDEALAAYQKILELNPLSAVAYNNIGSVQQAQGQTEAALENFRKAVKIEPRAVDAHCNIGTCLVNLGRYEESLESNFHTIALNPNDSQAHINIGAVLNILGRTNEAIQHCRLALQINPGWEYVHSNLLFSLSHSGSLSAKQLYSEHRRFGRQFETSLRADWPEHVNDRDPLRRLRVGFVSADLNDHAVASFITPVMEHLQHAQGIEMLVYYNSKRNDEVSRYLRTLVTTWHQIYHLSHAELAQQIVDDKIDILIDLSGHTGQNRLLTFARKPAPLQLSWIGYPGTTGLEAMDYYLTDRFASPPGLLDDQFTEKLLRLPACAPFLPSPMAPPVSPMPAVNHGHITFGSFNRANKLSREVIALWSTLLRAVPDAKMLIAGMSSEHVVNKLRDWFASEGIGAERLSFFTRSDIGDYLAMHRLVDVCLDTFPYPGGTTTCHALWMGVPTLTMTGATLASRIGATILEYADLTDFIAVDAEDFLQKGKSISKDIARLITLRGTLRTRMKNSSIGQPALIAAGVDDALRTIWQHWCANLPRVSFEANPQQSSLMERAISLKALHDVNSDAALVLAIEHHQAGRLVEAETLYLAIIHSHSEHAIANHNMGLLAGQLGFHNDALPYLRTALTARPDENQFYLSYAQALMQTDQVQAAISVLCDAIERGQDNADLRALLARARASKDSTSSMPTQKETDYIFELYDAGRHTEIEHAAQALVEQYPESSIAWSILGTSLQVLGKDALPSLQRTVQLAPQDAQAQFNLGNAWFGISNYDSAIQCYLRALDLEPAFAEAYINMGSAQHATGKTVEAVHSFRSALLVEPSNALAHANLGNTLAMMGESEGALESYRNALALVPDDAQLHHDVGDILQTLGRHAEATVSYRQASIYAGTADVQT
jgi:protein O-GlcNAc transferase